MLVEDHMAYVARGRGYTEQGAESEMQPARLSVGSVPPLRLMLETGQPMAIPSVHNHPAWVDVPSARWVQSYASAPIRAKGKVIGFLNLNSATDGFFTQAHAERLQAFADQAGVAIENARLYSSLQEANDKLSAALRSKEEMLQNVSHELRTPLTMIYGYIGLLERGDLGALTAEQTQAVRVMLRQGDKLRFMVDRLLMLQTFDAGALQRVRLDLCKWLPQAVEPWQVRAGLAGLELQVQTPAALVAVLADAKYLEHAIANLLDNAIKFSPGGGSILLRAWAEGDEAIIAVTDYGVGIAPEELPKVFELFHQADGSSTRRFGGMGIGLALCSRIVEGHHGRIWAESQGEGKGSTFYISLPVAQQANDA
jgi:signal transduction histidine kinase